MDIESTGNCGVSRRERTDRGDFECCAGGSFRVGWGMCSVTKFCVRTVGAKDSFPLTDDERGVAIEGSPAWGGEQLVGGEEDGLPNCIVTNWVMMAPWPIRRRRSTTVDFGNR